jgi:flagellar motor switch/type III secretory pathway protein FliN
MARITVSDKEIEVLVRESVGALEPFLDVAYPVEIQLGCRRMTVGELLSLRLGDQLKLERPSSNYVDLLIGGTRVGRVEVLARKRGSTARLVRLE